MTWHTLPTDDPLVIRALGKLDGDCLRYRRSDGTLGVGWVATDGGWRMLDKHGVALDDVAEIEADPRCKDCRVKPVARRDGGEPMACCESCAKARREKAATARAEALASGGCTYPSCKRKAAKGSKMCRTHLEVYRDYNAEQRARLAAG